MNGVIVCVPPGNKLGNSCMSYLHARAHAERVGAELQMDPWIGEKIFEVPINRIAPENRNLPRRNEFDLRPDETNVNIRTYAQSQSAMIYTRNQARKWLVMALFQEAVRLPVSWLNDHLDGPAGGRIFAHRRVGDYIGYGYPVVSELSYEQALAKFRLVGNLVFVTEENPSVVPSLPSELAFFPDFLRLLRAKILLRGNSSFSWLAGLLGFGHVFSPVIDGLEGGKEHDVRFVEGNWPRFANLPFVTDIYVKDE